MMSNSINGWGDDDSLGVRIARHRAPWSAEQRAMIDRETRVAEEWATTLREGFACDRPHGATRQTPPDHTPEIHGYDIKAGGPLYEPESPPPRLTRTALLIMVASAGATLALLWLAWRVAQAVSPW